MPKVDYVVEGIKSTCYPKCSTGVGYGEEMGISASLFFPSKTCHDVTLKNTLIDVAVLQVLHFI